MRKLPEPGQAPFGQRPTPELFDKSDKRRLILMSAALVALLVVFVIAQIQSGSGDQAAQDRAQLTTGVLDAAEELEVVVPAFDLERLRGKVSDSRETDRVLREGAGIEELARYVRGFANAQFAALGVRDLDAAALEEVRTDPDAQRAKPFRARGTLLELEARATSEGHEQLEGALALEDGGTAFFSVRHGADFFQLGDFVRVDGLFFKLFRDELDSGEWVEGPLLVGDRALRSQPRLGPFSMEHLRATLAEVEDDGTSSMTGLGGEAGLAKWELMRFSARPEAGEIDWDAAPELDSALLARLIREGAEFRGEPLRFPISRMQGMRTATASENPLRLARHTNGWIGNSNWTGGIGVVQFSMLPQERDLAIGAYVTARGFFLKNLAYEDRSGVMRTAPYFVLHGVEPFEMPEDTVMRNIAWFMVALTLSLAALFVVLLTRDRKKSLQFQAELVRRRRARRERQGAAGGDATP